MSLSDHDTEENSLSGSPLPFGGVLGGMFAWLIAIWLWAVSYGCI